MILVIGSAQLAIGAVSEGPINYTDPIIRLGVIGPQLDVPLMVGLGLLKFLGVEGSAGHLEKDGAGAIDGAQIVVVHFKDFLELVDGRVAEAHVLLRRRAGDVLAGISSGQIEAGIEQAGIEILGFLEILDSRVVLSALVSGNTLIEEVASLQFIAAGATDSQNHERGEGQSAANPSGTNHR